MWRKFPITHIGDLAITGTRLAVLGSLLLWLLFTLLGMFVFALAPATAVFGGLLATLLHWLSSLLHHLGHARAARRTGYPMREVRLLHVLAVSIYPRDEPELPAETHIKRALGGPPVNIILGLTSLAAALFIGESGGLWYLLALFFGLENLLLYGLGAFLPLGFTDGSTLLEWWPKRGQV
jgi:hypothetical protein